MTDGRIALIIPQLRGGGAQRVFVNLAQAFVERGLEVDFVVFRAEGPLVAEVPAVARLVDCAASNLGSAIGGVFRYMRREQPAAAMTTLREANVIGPLVRRLTGMRTRVVIREANTLADTLSAKQPLRDAVLSRLMRVSYGYADRIVANSQGTAADLIRFGLAGPENIEVIPNPVVTPQLLHAAAEPLDHPWFAEAAPPVIVAVGRLVKQKDYPSLLRAIQLLRKSCNARAMILGEGPERAHLECLVAELGLGDVLALPGYVRNPHRYVARAAVSVMSSRWEGFGNVLVEALAVGTPVVATDCPGGPAEILDRGRYGTLVPVGNPGSLADAIAQVLLEPPNRAALRARAACFSVDAVAPRYLSALGFE
jgi:glycosyltransferase involved in cell wall biosynthesis